MDSPEAMVVLVVDDEEPVRVVLSTILSMQKLRVEVARTGEEAVGLAATVRTRLRLAIVDCRLPGQRGEDLAELLRGIVPKCPLLFISGDGALASEISLRWPGSGFLSKPFGMRQLLAAIEHLVPDLLPGRIGVPSAERV